MRRISLATVLMVFACTSVPAKATESVGAEGLVTEVPLPPILRESDFRPFDPDRAALGRLLFYDKVLSGNRNISCGTCHHHDLFSADGLSLSLGEGGVGIGAERIVPDNADRPRNRVARNSPALFNLGHRDIGVMLHDGRVSDDDIYGVGFNTPAEEWLPGGLQSVLAAQSIMPFTEAVEMAGEPEENAFGAARNQRIDFVWPLLVERIVAIPEYVRLFTDAFDDVEEATDISIVHVGNAIDDFINGEWRALESPFDAYLDGDRDALTPRQRAGAELFFGSAGCANCHAGPLLTDHEFHALALPPFGPGRTRPFDPYARDLGRMGETDDPDDAYRFRTPALRNVAETGPWGHNGAYDSLEGIIRHHLDPLTALAAWDRTQVILPRDRYYEPTDFAVLSDRFEMARVRGRVDLEPTTLADEEIDALVDFLGSLTDAKALKGRLGRPTTVPSGLPVD